MRLPQEVAGLPGRFDTKMRSFGVPVKEPLKGSFKGSFKGI